MNRKGLMWVVLLVFVSVCASSSVQACGLLGERYASALVGFTRPGNDWLDNVDDSILHLGAGLNWPVRDDLDVVVSLSHQRLDGTAYSLMGGSDRLEATTTGVFAGVNLQLRPGESVNPFLIGRMGLVRSEGEREGPAGTDSWDDTDGALAAGAGVQFDAAKDVAVAPSFVYHRTGGADDISLGTEVSLCLAERIFGLGGLSVGFHEGDVSFFLGAGLKF
jgi:opacity protein-like surface antigen